MKKESGSVRSIFIRYVTLNVLGMIGLSCYILADTFFVGKGLGLNGLTALNLAIPVYSFINGFGLMIGMGGSTRYAILNAYGDRKAGNVVFTQALIFALAIAFILMLTGIFGAPALTSLLGADASVFEDTKTYLRVVLIFAPMFLLNNILICFVRNDENPKLATAAMLTGSFSNILLDYVFIFILHMGMFGAVIATGLAPVISLTILSIHFKLKKNKFKLTKIRSLTKGIVDIASLGVSFLVSEVSGGIVIIIFNMIMLWLRGNIGVAAYGVVANLSLVATAILTGIAQGIQPLLSQSYGRRELDTASKVYQYGLFTAILVAVFMYSGIYIFSEPIADIFNENHSIEFIQIASEGMHLYFTAFVFVAFNIITAVRFNSTGNAKNAFMIALLRGFIFIIPFALLLAKLFGMTGIWLALPVTELLTAILCAVMLLREKKHTLK